MVGTAGEFGVGVLLSQPGWCSTARLAPAFCFLWLNRGREAGETDTDTGDVEGVGDL